MIKKYILNSIKFNRNKSKILLISSCISLVLLLVFTLIFFSVSTGLKNKNNQKFGEYDLQFGYIEKNVFFDNDKIREIPIPYEQLNKLLVLELEDKTTIYGLENNSMELAKYQTLNGNKELNTGEIVINKNYADKYKLEVGDTITIYNNSYKISAIVSSNIQDSLSLKIFINLSDLQKNNKYKDKVNLLQLKTKANKEAIKQMLEQYFNDKKLKYDSMKSKELDYKKIRIYTPLFYIMVTGMFLTYIISLFGIFKMRIRSRFFEMTVLKRMGISHKHLNKIFIGENLILATVGSVLGIFLSGGIYLLSNSIFKKLDVSFEILSFSTFVFCAVVYLLLNQLIVFLVTYLLLRKEKNKYVDDIEVIHKKDSIINTRLRGKTLFLLIINLLFFVLSKVLDNENFKYLTVAISIVSFFIVFKYCFVGLYKLSEREKFFDISYPVKSFANNYKKYAMIMKLMVLSIVLLLFSFNFLSIFSNKVKENTLNQLPADYIITNADQNKSENFVNNNDLKYIMEKIRSNDIVEILYTKDYRIASNVPYSDDWKRLSEKSKVDINEIEIIKLDIEKRDKLRTFNVISGKKLNNNFLDNELILNEKLRGLLNLQLGDTLDLKDSRTGKLEKYVISTIIDNQFYPYNLVAIAPKTSKIETSNILSVEVYNTDNNTDVIKNYVNSNRHLEGLYTRDVISENLQFYNFVYFGLLFLNIFILIIFVINLFNSMILSLEERKAEIQILKNMGISLDKIRTFVIGEIYMNFIGVLLFSLLIIIYISLVLSLAIEVKLVLMIYGLLLASFIILLILSRRIVK